jgi:hypothetical protein
MPSLPDERAVQLGVLVAIGNLLIFQHYLPPVVDERAGDQFDTAAEKAEREALFVSIAFSAVVAGYVRNWHTFVIAGLGIVIVDFAHKHANAINPFSQTMQVPGGTIPSGLDASGVHNLPDYQTATG